MKLGSTTLSIFHDGVASSATLDAPPVIIAGRTMVPVRAVLEAFGGSVDWDAASKKASVTLGRHTLQLVIGSDTAFLNGKSMPIDEDAQVVPVIRSGRTLLPLRFVGESLGMTVNWQASTGTITLSLTSS